MGFWWPAHHVSSNVETQIIDGQPAVVQHVAQGSGEQDVEDLKPKKVYHARVVEHPATKDDPAPTTTELRSDAYVVERYLCGKWRAERLSATWLKPRTYEPPLANGTTFVIVPDGRGRYAFAHPGCLRALGETVDYQGLVANIPVGWLLCNKANHDAGAVNGITVLNCECRVVMMEGLAANAALFAGDTAADMERGDAGGYNEHGDDANNHTHPSHTLTGGTGSGFGDTIHTHQYQLFGWMGPFPVLLDNSGLGAGDTSDRTTAPDMGHAHSIFNATINNDVTLGSTCNQMPYVVMGKICFVGV